MQFWKLHLQTSKPECKTGQYKQFSHSYNFWQTNKLTTLLLIFYSKDAQMHKITKVELAWKCGCSCNWALMQNCPGCGQWISLPLPDLPSAPFLVAEQVGKGGLGGRLQLLPSFPLSYNAVREEQDVLFSASSGKVLEPWLNAGHYYPSGITTFVIS